MLPRGRCHDCGSYEILAQVDRWLDHWVCEDCYDGYKKYKCTVCDRKIHEDDVVIDAHNEPVCPVCLKEDYDPCEFCGNYYTEDELKTDDFHNLYCETCKDEGQGSWQDELEGERIDILYSQRRDSAL